MGLEENAVIYFLRKLDAAPFLVNYQGTQYKIGEGEPTFTVSINKELDVKELMTSTSLGLAATVQGILAYSAGWMWLRLTTPTTCPSNQERPPVHQPCNSAPTTTITTD